jgi:hypothetical protein
LADYGRGVKVRVGMVLPYGKNIHFERYLASTRTTHMAVEALQIGKVIITP